MPQNHPEDRVRVKNIVNPDYQDVQQMFSITRMRKEKVLDINGVPQVREIPFYQEFEWDFKDGFLFVYGGKPYVIRPNEAKTYPRFLADHCIKNQVQHVLNHKYQATKRMDSNNVPVYDRGILTNQQLIKQLTEACIQGVEEWYEGNTDDFDTILNRQFGENIDTYIDENAVTSKADMLLDEIDLSEAPELEEKAKRVVPKSKDVEVQKARDEADALGVDWQETDSAESIKTKIIKVMG